MQEIAVGMTSQLVRGRVAACLHYNRANLSPRCQQALIALHEGR